MATAHRVTYTKPRLMPADRYDAACWVVAWSCSCGDAGAASARVQDHPTELAAQQAAHAAARAGRAAACLNKRPTIEGTVARALTGARR